jgi:hypothetical protein
LGDRTDEQVDKPMAGIQSVEYAWKSLLVKQLLAWVKPEVRGGHGGTGLPV